MNATISQNKYTNIYQVKKWDTNNNVIDTFNTKYKHLAYEKFSEWA